jgi:hypothetical protein
MTVWTMKKLLLIAMQAVVGMGSVQAQDGETGRDRLESEATARGRLKGSLEADVVSRYIWRGLELGHVSLQPRLSVGWRGLNLTVEGNVGLTGHGDDPNEIDLTLAYETGGLSFGVNDYWDDQADQRYFYYKKDGTGHSFEAFVCYDFGPVSASWQTYFAGNDYQEDSGKRAFSSYFELSAPFRLLTCDWNVEVGIVPWKSGTYEVNRFNVTNISLRATKAIRITKSFSLPLFGQLVANPASKHFHFVFGLTLKAL